jgi:hypothetical protein
MELEEVLLILSVKKADARLSNSGRTIYRNPFELVGVAAKAALRLVGHIENARVRVATVGTRAVQRRPERVAFLRHLQGRTQAEPDRRGDQEAQGAGRSER